MSIRLLLPSPPRRRIAVESVRRANAAPARSGAVIRQDLVARSNSTSAAARAARYRLLAQAARVGGAEGERSDNSSIRLLATKVALGAPLVEKIKKGMLVANE